MRELGSHRWADWVNSGYAGADPVTDIVERGSLMKTQRHPPPVEVLAEALTPILRSGLPVDPDVDDERLLGLRGVYARSIDPRERTSRVKALDGLLRSQLVHFPDDHLGEAARVLFGLTPGTRGLTLTARREQAAREIDYDADHMRKHIEPKIVRLLAWQLHQDSQNYIPRARDAPPKLDPSGDTPVITKGDVSSKEQSEHEEQLSRLWAHVYALRAEILRVERLKTWAYDETERQLSQEHLDQAIAARDRQIGYVRQRVKQYMDAYGGFIRHGEGEFTAEGLLRLAGWSGS